MLTTLYNFGGGTDGAGPAAVLVQGTDGNFYGTTQQGGTTGFGTAFKITTAGALTTLYTFAGTTDGTSPAAALVVGTNGNFYGTTSQAGANGLGTVFQMTSAGALTTLYSFAGTPDGARSAATLVQATDGNFYSTTPMGGTSNLGFIFRLSVVQIPNANNGSVNVGFNTPTSVTLTGTDNNSPAQTLSYAIATGPSHGTLGTLNASTGTVVYTPTGGYHGSDSFTFNDSNGTNTSSTVTVSLTVATGTPTANAQNVSVPANTALNVTLNASDSDTPALTLTYSATQPGHGTLSGTAPNLTYTPTANYVGTDSFTFTASNGTNTSSAATVSISVTGSAPAITSVNTKVFTIGTTGTFTVTTTGVPTSTLSGSGTLPTGVSFTDNGNGTATLSGAAAAGSNASYPLTITAHNVVKPDATQTFTLLINHAPTVAASTLAATQNMAASVAVAQLLTGAYDADGDALSVTAVSAASAAGGTVVLSAPGNNGTVTYTPANNFTGTDSFTFTVSDGRGGMTAGGVTVTVSSANATLSVVSITMNTSAVVVVYAGIPGHSYQPQYADSLVSPWTSVGSTQTADSNGQFTYTDTTQPQPGQRFYRAIAAP